jgi:hypothetical protein
MDFMIHHEGRELGPYSESEVRSRLLAGAISLTDLGWHEGATDWAPLSTFQEFGPSHRQTSPTKSSLPELDIKTLGPYTAATLQANERPLYKTTIHWMVLVNPFVWVSFSLIIILPIAMFASWKGYYWGWALLLIPIALLLSAAIAVKTSELVITDRRVLIKVGFIQRQTFEMFISKIESVAVVQGMVGRIFNYGTVEIRGTGGSSESFATIAEPLQFRDAIQLVQSESEKR